MSKRYVVLTAHDMDCDKAESYLEELVESYIDAGWEISFGVSISVSPSTDDDYKEYHLAQAMTGERND